jgi:SPW repeat
VTHVNGNDGIGVAARGRSRRSWPVNALLAVGGWLVVSPPVLGTAQVTACLVSAVTGGLALVVLAGWARVARNRVPPMLIALSLGVWLLLAPTMWEFADGADAWPLVPIPPSDVTEPTRAMVARADWNSILAGLLTLTLAGSALLAGRRRQGRPASDGREHRQQVEAPDGRR